MAGNSRSPRGGMPGAHPGRPSFDEEEKTAIDPGFPVNPPTGWGESETNDGRPRGKRSADEEDAEGATFDEYTMEESARGIRELIQKPVNGALAISAGNDKGKVIELKGRSLSIGRGVDNDIVLTDLAVSRHHLLVEYHDGRYFVQDQGSGNGTLINDVEERDRCILNGGDRLEIGNTIITVDLPKAAVAADKTMDIGDDDSSLIPVPEIDGRDSAFAGRRDGRRLVGAGVAKAKAARAKQAAGRRGDASIGNRVTRRPVGAQPEPAPGLRGAGPLPGRPDPRGGGPLPGRPDPRPVPDLSSLVPKSGPAARPAVPSRPPGPGRPEPQILGPGGSPSSDALPLPRLANISAPPPA
ncbi:MAG: FHA domain-containing protein, partial [Deltaproteobacteria bacterium]|nr:FHA domain-containing protein [Deltaproteobacteria bacterium]